MKTVYRKHCNQNSSIIGNMDWIRTAINLSLNALYFSWNYQKAETCYQTGFQIMIDLAGQFSNHYVEKLCSMVIS